LRAKGRIAVSFERRGDGATRPVSLEEAGGFRMRFPRVHGTVPPSSAETEGAVCEASIINTGGGMAGGDRLTVEVEARRDARILLSTPSAERVYGSTGPAAEIALAFRLGGGSRLIWLPRETILYSGSRLERRIDVEMHGGASLVIAEMTVFGRLAAGERMRSGLLAERWSIRRDGRLLHAERTRLEGEIGQLLDRGAIGGGARAAATVVMASSRAEDRLAAVRARLRRAHSEWGASAWDGLLVGRFLGADAATLRSDLVCFLLAAGESRLPHSWARDPIGEDAANPDAVERTDASMANNRAGSLMEDEVEPDPA
jgi:urease accessory protein